FCVFFFFSSRRRHTRSDRDWSSDVCSSDLHPGSGSGGSWRGALGIAQRQIPTRVVGSRELGWRLPAELRMWPSVVIVGSPAAERSEERRVGEEWRSRGGGGE